MKHIITDTSVVIFNDNHRVVFSKDNFNNEILNDAILEQLTFEDLFAIWKDLYGVPKNVKKILEKKIELYRQSSNVHSFIYKDKEYWLDKNNRICLLNLSNSSVGNVDFIVGNEIVTIPSLKLKAFLLKLEVYSYKCYVNTFKHLKAVENLIKLEDIVKYDYTTGYPEKIILQ